MDKIFDDIMLPCAIALFKGLYTTYNDYPQTLRYEAHATLISKGICAFTAAHIVIQVIST